MLNRKGSGEDEGAGAGAVQRVMKHAAERPGPRQHAVLPRLGIFSQCWNCLTSNKHTHAQNCNFYEENHPALHYVLTRNAVSKLYGKRIQTVRKLINKNNVVILKILSCTGLKRSYMTKQFIADYKELYEIF